MDSIRDPLTVVVTGATSGIGFALAQELAARGLNLIGVGRSETRCAGAAAQLSGANPHARLTFLVADLSLQRNVRALARQVESQLDRWGVAGLAGLVNNAGTFTFWQTLTPEGFEMQWAVNHLAPFLLTHELLPRLSASESARVVTVSSGSHYGARLNWDDLQLSRRYNPLRAYKQSKLANVAFSAELNRRLGADSTVRAFAADPGLVDTEMGAKAGSWLARWIWAIRRRSGVPADQSAAPIAELLLAEDVDTDEGIYWKHGRPKAPDPYALDPEIGWRLWQVSAKMCGVEAEVPAP